MKNKTGLTKEEFTFIEPRAFTELIAHPQYAHLKNGLYVANEYLKRNPKIDEILSKETSERIDIGHNEKEEEIYFTEWINSKTIAKKLGAKLLNPAELMFTINHLIETSNTNCQLYENLLNIGHMEWTDCALEYKIKGKIPDIDEMRKPVTRKENILHMAYSIPVLTWNLIVGGDISGKHGKFYHIPLIGKGVEALEKKFGKQRDEIFEKYLLQFRDAIDRTLHIDPDINITNAESQKYKIKNSTKMNFPILQCHSDSGQLFGFDLQDISPQTGLPNHLKKKDNTGFAFTDTLFYSPEYHSKYAQIMLTFSNGVATQDKNGERIYENIPMLEVVYNPSGNAFTRLAYTPEQFKSIFE